MNTIEKTAWDELAYLVFFDYSKVMANMQNWNKFVKKLRENKPLEEKEYEEMVNVMRSLPEFVERLHKQSIKIVNKLNNDN